jgi:hypothetical protein
LAVSRFIKNFAFLDDFTKKPIIVSQAALDLPRSTHDQVERKLALKRCLDADGLIDRILGPHDYEQIDVALYMWRPISVGAKQYDLVRLKALGDEARETANRRQGDVGRSVTVWLPVAGDDQFFGHVSILPRNPASPPHRVYLQMPIATGMETAFRRAFFFTNAGR